MKSSSFIFFTFDNEARCEEILSGNDHGKFREDLRHSFRCELFFIACGKNVCGEIADI